MIHISVILTFSSRWELGSKCFLQLHNNFLHLQIWSTFWFQTFQSPQKHPPRTFFHVFSCFQIFFNFITNLVVSVLPAPDSPLTKIDCDAFLSLIPWNLFSQIFAIFGEKFDDLRSILAFWIRILQKSSSESHFRILKSMSENPCSKFEIECWKP